MADMDSPAARSRQNPSSYRRATTRPRPAARRRGSKPSPPSGNISRKRRAARRSSAPTRSRRRTVSNRSSRREESSQSRRRSTIRRRAKQPTNRNRQPTRPKPPVKPKPPVTPKPPVVKKPLTPEQQRAQIEAYLRGDSTYQSQLAQLNKSLADFQAEQGLSKTDYETNYQNTSRDIGLARDDALEALKNDFASRGLLHSSMYNTEGGELRSQYQNQFTDLGEQRTGFMDQLVQDLNRFRGEQTVTQQNARAEAIRRRAEKQGI